MIKLPNTLSAWNTPAFRETFKREAEQLNATLLPLQQGLERSSYVADEPFSVMLLATEETPETLRVKAGVSYAGILPGCSCADDPTALDTQTEYCEVWFSISRQSSNAMVVLASAG